jgi:hypothetical protein
VPVTAIDGRHPKTGHEGPEVELRNNTILSLTSIVDRVDDQYNEPTTLRLGMTGSFCIGE